MTDKEILAELKICYELLDDIRENNEERFNDEEDTILWKMGEQIDNLYSKIYESVINSEDKDELKIKTKQEFDSDIIIADNVYTDYNFVKKGTFEVEKDKYNDMEFTTYEDIGYNWCFDEIGYNHNNYEYDSLANGFIKALDEICGLKKELGQEFDYFDKACDLLNTNNSNVLNILDEYGSDNDEE